MGIGIWIYNNSGSTKNYGHGDIADDTYWEIPTQAIRDRLVTLAALITDYSASDAQTSLNGTSIISGTTADHWNALRAPTMNFDKKTGVYMRPEVAVYEPEGDFETLVTHDFTDATTWYQGSTEVTGETLSTIAGLVYGSAHTNWIDVTHGKLTQEGTLSSYAPKVYDNGVLLTEGDDYTIDYALGRVTLLASPTSPITADYFYAGNSTYSVIPASGKISTLKHAELQFTKDVVMNPMSFEVWAYNPNDLPNKMMVDQKVYKNEKDVINIANLGQGYIPKFGSIQNDVLVFPFKYARSIDLKYSLGMEIRVRSLSDTEFTGEFATITFYTIPEDE